LSYHLEALARAGIRDVVINLSWLPDKIRTALGDGSDYGVRISYTDEGPVALETGGGIFNAIQTSGSGAFPGCERRYVHGYGFGALQAGADADTRAGLWRRLVLVAQSNTTPAAISVSRASGSSSARRSFYLFRCRLCTGPEFFAGSQPGKFPLLPLFKRAIAAGVCYGELFEGEWNDVGTPQRLAEWMSGRAVPTLDGTMAGCRT